MSKFLDPSLVVAQTGISYGQTVADFGCGSGFYSVAAAQLVGNSGMVYAVDVVEAKLAATASIANQMGLKNLKFVKADLIKPITVISPDSCDAVIMSNILHLVEARQQLLKNAYRVLKSGGKLLVVEWKKILTPIGPEVKERIQPQELETLTLSTGFRRLQLVDSDNYHYAEIFTK